MVCRHQGICVNSHHQGTLLLVLPVVDTQAYVGHGKLPSQEVFNISKALQSHAQRASIQGRVSRWHGASCTMD